MSADGDGANGANVVKLPPTITVRELGELLHSTSIDVIKELMKRGVMAAINQSVDYDMAASVAQELGFQPQPADGAAARSTAATRRSSASSLQSVAASSSSASAVRVCAMTCASSAAAPKTWSQ